MDAGNHATRRANQFSGSGIESTLRLFAATSAGIYRSDDVGDHWYASSNGLPAGAAAWDVAVAADQTTIYASIPSGTAGTGVVYRSVDGGQSWSPTTLEKRGLFGLTPHPTDARTLLIDTNEGAFKTTDGGLTFQPLELFPGVTNAPVSDIAIDPVDPNIIYVETLSEVGNVVRSVDGGVASSGYAGLLRCRHACH